MPSIKPQIISIVFVCTALTIVFLVFAYFIYPGSTGEGKLYVVPAIQFANKKVLDSPFLPPLGMVENNKEIFKSDPNANSKMLYYPPLGPMALGYLMGKNATPDEAFMILAVLNSIVLFLAALLLYKALTAENKQITWFGVLVIVMSLFGIATNIHIEGGRPETIARLFFVLGTIGMFVVPKRYDWILFGILLGLIGATHPVGGVIFGLFAAAILAFRWELKKAFVRTLLVFLIGIGIFAIIVAIGPYHIVETIQGILANASVEKSLMFTEKRTLSLDSLYSIFFINPITPFYGPLMVLFLVFGGIYYVRTRNRSASPAFFTFWVGALAIIILFFLVYDIKPNHYYFILFAPLIFTLVSYYAVSQRGFIKYGVLIIIGLTGIGFLRSVVMFPFFIKYGVSLEVARNYIAGKDLINSVKAQVGLTGGLWALFSDYDNKFIYPNSLPEGKTTILFQEGSYGQLTPPEIPGCELKENHFVSREIRILNIKVANRMPGYAFALYKCITPRFNLTVSGPLLKYIVASA